MGGYAYLVSRCRLEIILDPRDGNRPWRTPKDVQTVKKIPEK